MVKLVDAIGTQYLAAHFDSEVRDLLAREKEVDLAGARICRKVMQVVMSAFGNDVMLYDTEDAERQALLDETYERRKYIYSCIPLPKLDVYENIPAYIQSLDKNAVYSIDNSDAQIHLATLITLTRPRIKIDAGTYWKDWFQYIRSIAPLTGRVTWDEWYVAMGTTYFRVTVNNGRVRIPGFKTYSYKDFISREICIPTVFGKECLVKNSFWDVLCSSVVDDIKGDMKNMHRTTITEFFKGGI